jgi:4-aminobutyrate aminotransferase-like enzyme/Ser/Thr protein kinase RdoA (MazF antagonist)
VPGPFAAVDVVPPEVPAELAERILQEHWGLAGRLTELGSQQDRNWLVDTGDERAVLKVANPAFPREELEAQDAALRHLHTAAPDLEVPLPRPARDGTTLVPVAIDGTTTVARVLHFLDGATLADAGYLAPPVLRAVGRLVASTTRALADFDHPGAHRDSQWDVRHTREVLAAVGRSLPERDRPLLAAVAAVGEVLDPRCDELPEQRCHADLNANNLVWRPGRDGRPRPVGVIDLGDLVHTWRVADPAITIASLAAHAPGDPLRLVREVVRGFVEVVPLTEHELAALWPLVVWRGVVDAAATAHQTRLDPGNAYTGEGLAAILAAARELAAVPVPLATAVVREAAGLDPWPEGRDAVARLRPRTAGTEAVGGAGGAEDPTLAPTDGLARLLPDLAGSPVVVVPLDATSDVLDGAAWERPADLRAALTVAAGVGATVVCRWGEGRLTVAPAPQEHEPASVHLGVDVIAPVGTAVHAPVDGRVVAVRAGEVVVASDGVDLRLAGVDSDLEVGTTVAAGDAIGVVAEAAPDATLPPHVHVQLVTAPGLAAPGDVPGSLAGAWRALCPDPSPLLGVAAGAPDPRGRALAERRAAVLAGAQQHYYDEPPRIERGAGAVLYDTAGRGYLDVVNNVAAIGHSHPHLTAAVHRQLGRLNTNSRFHHAAMVELAERLVALLPAPLDTVFLVNSGSEADEVALRLVRAATGQRDVVCFRGAYHGWTLATDALTTPAAEVEHPLEPWVHPIVPPGPSGGARAVDVAGSLAALEAVLDRLAADGRSPAAFLSEAVLGNSGGVLLPDGYLAAVYERVRAAGGYCIADEVQVGYGRRGTSFWAFEREGVVPDVVTIAKAAGNGVPFGAAITTRAIADAYARTDSFFSSAGGSPAACAAAMAVLDVIEAEDLQGNARRVGARLRAGLDELATRHPTIVAVHGEGLYLGVQLGGQDPAAVALAVCDRLLERGVICQPTGERGDVLKVKPPLVLSAEQADRFVAQLDAVLTGGW